MAFDVDSARKAGYSDTEIADYLGQQAKFDTGAARQAGYSDQEIIGHLTGAGPLLANDQSSPATAPQANVSPAQAKANTDAQRRESSVSGLERAVGSGFLPGASYLDAAVAAGETGLHNAFAHATGRPDSGYGMGEAFNAVRQTNAQAQNAFAQQQPGWNIAGNVIGAVANPVNALAGRAIAAAPNLISRIGVGAATGAGIGAAYGAGDTQPGQSVVQNAKQGAEFGAITGGAAPVVGSVARGVGNAIGIKSGTTNYAPIVQGLKAAKNAAYKAADNMGVAYTPEAAKGLAQTMQSDLQSELLSNVQHPKASAMLATVKQELTSGEPITLSKLDQLRQVIRRDITSLKQDGKPTPDALMGQRMIDSIDEFVDSAKPAQVTTGTAQTMLKNAGLNVGGPAAPEDAAAAIQNARAANTQFRKAEKVANLVESADQKGGNVAKRLQPLMDPTSRQQVRNFTPQEQNALNTVVRGTPAQNVMQGLGKLSPEGRLMPILHLGAAAGTHGLSLLGSVTGLIAKHISDQQTQRNVANLIQTIAQGAPGETTNAERQLAFMATKDPGIAAVYREVRARLYGAAPALAGSAVNQMNQPASAPGN